jgi:hypothetical protein
MIIAMTDTPPPRRSRTLRRVLIIVAVVLVVCCAGAAAAAFGIYKWYNGAAGPAQATVDLYLGELEAGHPGPAYLRTCPEFRSHVSRDAFITYESQAPTPKSHRITGTSISTVNGQSSALVSVAVTRSDGGVQHVTIPLSSIDRVWYVCPEGPVP